MYPTLERLKQLHEPTPITQSLPTLAQLEAFEKKNGIRFPDSFREFQLHYSHLNVGYYRPYMIDKPDIRSLDYQTNLQAAYDFRLPKNLFPFAEDNSDYFAFDLNSQGPDYEVVFWSHDGIFKEERWDNFLDWVEKDWIQGAEEDE